MRQLAQKSANFGFLLDDAPLLLSYGAAAEAYVFDDPNTSMVKARQFGEALADALLVRLGVPSKSATQAEKVAELTRLGILTPNVRQVLDEVRRSGNKAVHSHAADQRTALGLVHRCFRLGEWFHRAVTGDRSPIVFVPPTPTTPVPDLEATLTHHREQLVEMRTSLADALSRSQAEEQARRQAEEELSRAADSRAQAEVLVADLQKQIEQLRADLTAQVAAPPKVSARQRDTFVDRAREASRPPLTEAETRREIDAMLVASGWVVQDIEDLGLISHLGVAVREMPLGGGRADYALHVDGKLVGVVEAKREGTRSPPCQTSRPATPSSPPTRSCAPGAHRFPSATSRTGPRRGSSTVSIPSHAARARCSPSTARRPSPPGWPTPTPNRRHRPIAPGSVVSPPWTKAGCGPPRSTR